MTGSQGLTVKRVCLISPGHVAFNPRLVKEADALVDAGHDVHVICSHMVSWADEADKKLLATRKWRLRPCAVSCSAS